MPVAARKALLHQRRRHAEPFCMLCQAFHIRTEGCVTAPLAPVGVASPAEDRGALGREQVILRRHGHGAAFGAEVTFHRQRTKGAWSKTKKPHHLLLLGVGLGRDVHRRGVAQRALARGHTKSFFVFFRIQNRHLALQRDLIALSFQDGLGQERFLRPRHIVPGFFPVLLELAVSRASNDLVNGEPRHASCVQLVVVGAEGVLALRLGVADAHHAVDRRRMRPAQRTRAEVHLGPLPVPAVVGGLLLRGALAGPLQRTIEKSLLLLLLLLLLSSHGATLADAAARPADGSEPGEPVLAEDA
mmetsp:Transcript_61228/g.177564  ORF Transcript_61228/g.177564 Transcript_61228/m.177564 type:complete len:301 (+) Transcript_61228:2670-3572(+)